MMEAEVSSLSTCFQINRFIEASVNFMPTIRQEAGFQTAIQACSVFFCLFSMRAGRDTSYDNATNTLHWLHLNSLPQAVEK